MSRTWFNGALTEGPLEVARGERGLLLGVAPTDALRALQARATPITA